MVIVFPLVCPPDSKQQAPGGYEALQLLKSSIEKYEDWKSSLTKPRIEIETEAAEVCKDKETRVRTTNNYSINKNISSGFGKSEYTATRTNRQIEIKLITDKRAQTTTITKTIVQAAPERLKNLRKPNKIEELNSKDKKRVAIKTLLSKSVDTKNIHKAFLKKSSKTSEPTVENKKHNALKSPRKTNKINDPLTQAKAKCHKNVNLRKKFSNKPKTTSRVCPLKSVTNSKSEKSSGRLCLDATKKSQIHKCACRKKQTKIEKPKLPPLVSSDISHSNDVDNPEPARKKKVKRTVSEIKRNLRKFGMSESQAEKVNIIGSIPVSPNVPEFPISEFPLPIRKEEIEAPADCTKVDLKGLLKKCKYTNSEIDILLEELLAYPNMVTPLDRFLEMLGDTDQYSSLFIDEYPEETGLETDIGKGEGEEVPQEGKDAVQYEEMEEEDWDQEVENEEDEEMFAMGGTYDEVVEEEVYTGEEEVEDETDQEEQQVVDAPPEEVKVAIEETIGPSASARLNGILYQAMSRYYNTRAEGLMSIKHYLDDENKQEFHDILLGAVKEQGLPCNEEALRVFLSNITDVKLPGIQRMDPVKIADFYESIHFKKIGKCEKYASRKITSLGELFKRKYPVERDLFELLAPYLNEIRSEIKKSTTSKKEVTKKKRRKKSKKVVEKDSGPFNVLIRSGVRNKVWRSALKKLKKKTEVLKKVIEYKQRAPPQYEKSTLYHQHFAEYFKKKKTELKRIRRNRKTSALIKVIHLGLSEAESTSSFSSGDYYPERGLMKSILHNYTEEAEFPVPTLERNKEKIGKREKMKKEKLFQRSGVEGGIRGAPNTPMEEKTWHEKARKKKFKRRARVVEEYLYSSGDEIIGLKNPPQKLEKQAVIRELADQLLKVPKEVKPEDEIGKIKKPLTAESKAKSEMEKPKPAGKENPQSTKSGNEISRNEKENTNTEKKELKNEKEKDPAKEMKTTEKKKEPVDDLTYNFFLVCSKHKMMFVYYLVKRYKVLKSPLDERFMRNTIKLSDTFEPFELMSSQYRVAAKKLFKLGVRTVFGMYYMGQKQKNIFNMVYERNDSEPTGFTEDKADQQLYSEKNLHALLSNATIQRERHMKWIRSYCGIENTIKTQRMMSQYFGPIDEPWIYVEPLKKKKSIKRG